MNRILESNIKNGGYGVEYNIVCKIIDEVELASIWRHSH